LVWTDLQYWIAINSLNQSELVTFLARDNIYT